MYSKRCIVKDCGNHLDAGLFIGDVCAPCYEFLTKRKGIYSQAYRNTMNQLNKESDNA